MRAVSRTLAIILSVTIAFPPVAVAQTSMAEMHSAAQEKSLEDARIRLDEIDRLQVEIETLRDRKSVV